MAHDADSPDKDHSPRFKDPSTFKDAEVAHYIGMSESWLRQSRMRGNPKAPPYIKIGKSVRYLKADLDDWLDRLRHVESGGRGRLA
ncbi:MAG: helix-turn-helix domain-containing protein [Alphaproteobacteria bacterium]|nr:helix-turn-helix domain-containing protein [Alphaproteobacteria bacterium]